MKIICLWDYILTIFTILKVKTDNLKIISQSYANTDNIFSFAEEWLYFLNKILLIVVALFYIFTDCMNVGQEDS